jgi:3'(2'), 5'-bisphosphate nucleotidase
VPESDDQLATRIATETGRLLVRAREEQFSQGASTWNVKDAGDDLARAFLSKESAAHRPDDAALSEEGREDPRRFGVDRVWIIDPLDGGHPTFRPIHLDQGRMPDSSRPAATPKGNRAPALCNV